MTTAAYIANIYQEAYTAGAGKLSGRERGFIESIYRASLHPGFTGLSAKQRAWFNAIAMRLEASKGKLAVQVIGEKHRRRFRYYQDSYYVACAGW